MYKPVHAGSSCFIPEYLQRFLKSQHFATRAESTRKELSRIVEVDLLPEWAGQRLSTIERQEIQRWGDRIVSQGRRYMANRCREYMQLIWHWGLGRAELSVLPSPFYKLPKPFLGEAPRDRVLSHEEFRRVFAAIEREPRITAAWWVMLFLTAAHDKSEVMRMEKAEVDRDRNVWIIPRERQRQRGLSFFPSRCGRRRCSRRSDPCRAVLDKVILKGQGKEIAMRAIITPRTYEGWNRWASQGRGQRRQQTWAERKARLAAEGRNLIEEHRQRQAAARTGNTDESRAPAVPPPAGS